MITMTVKHILIFHLQMSELHHSCATGLSYFDDEWYDEMKMFWNASAIDSF